MQFNFYPYNYYILYASIVATVVCIFLSLKALVRNAQAARSIPFEQLNANLTQVAAKEEAAGKVIKRAGEGMKMIGIISFFLLVLRHYYKNSERNGIGGLFDASMDILRDSLTAQYHISQNRKSR